MATEIKTWNPLYETDLRQHGYETIHTVSTNPRGGVAVIIKIAAVRPSLVATIAGTAILVELYYKQKQYDQKILLNAAYINPDPNQDEKESIHTWEDLTEKYVTDSNFPMVLTGDLNS